MNSSAFHFVRKQRKFKSTQCGKEVKWFASLQANRSSHLSFIGDQIVGNHLTEFGMSKRETFSDSQIIMKL